MPEHIPETLKRLSQLTTGVSLPLCSYTEDIRSGGEHPAGILSVFLSMRL